MSEPTAETTPQAGAADANKSQALNSNPQAGTEPNPNQPKEVKELPDWAQSLISDLRTESATNRKAIQAQQTEKQKAEQAALVEQGKFKELAEKHEGRVKELEPVLDRYTRLSGIVLNSFSEQVKDWPKEVKELLPTGDKVDPLDYIEAVDKYRPLAQKLGSGNAQQGRSGNVPNPQAAGNETETARRERLANELRAKGFGRI